MHWLWLRVIRVATKNIKYLDLTSKLLAAYLAGVDGADVVHRCKPITGPLHTSVELRTPMQLSMDVHTPLCTFIPPYPSIPFDTPLCVPPQTSHRNIWHKSTIYDWVEVRKLACPFHEVFVYSQFFEWVTGLISDVGRGSKFSNLFDPSLRSTTSEGRTGLTLRATAVVRDRSAPNIQPCECTWKKPQARPLFVNSLCTR